MQEVFAVLEALDDHPDMGQPDEAGLLGGRRLYQFRIERLPIILRFTVAYDVRKTAEGHETWILDIVPRFVDER